MFVPCWRIISAILGCLPVVVFYLIHSYSILFLPIASYYVLFRPIFLQKFLFYLHISKIFRTFAPANSRWGVCIDVATWVSRHIEWRLLTLVFDRLEPRKLQTSIISKTRRSRCSWVYNTPTCTI